MQKKIMEKIVSSLEEKKTTNVHLLSCLDKRRGLNSHKKHADYTSPPDDQQANKKGCRFLCVMIANLSKSGSGSPHAFFYTQSFAHAVPVGFWGVSRNQTFLFHFFSLSCICAHPFVRSVEFF